MATRIGGSVGHRRRIRDFRLRRQAGCHQRRRPPEACGRRPAAPVRRSGSHQGAAVAARCHCPCAQVQHGLPHAPDGGGRVARPDAAGQLRPAAEADDGCRLLDAQQRCLRPRLHALRLDLGHAVVGVGTQPQLRQPHVLVECAGFRAFLPARQTTCRPVDDRRGAPAQGGAEPDSGCPQFLVAGRGRATAAAGSRHPFGRGRPGGGARQVD